MSSTDTVSTLDVDRDNAWRHPYCLLDGLQGQECHHYRDRACIRYILAVSRPSLSYLNHAHFI